MDRDVRCFLIERARLKNNEKISYSELSESCKLNLNMDEPHHRNLIGEILGNISVFEFNNNRPLLSSLVIGKDNNVGDGFYKLCEELGKGDWQKLKNNFYVFQEMNNTIEFWRNNSNYTKYFII